MTNNYAVARIVGTWYDRSLLFATRLALVKEAPRSRGWCCTAILNRFHFERPENEHVAEQLRYLSMWNRQKDQVLQM